MRWLAPLSLALALCDFTSAESSVRNPIRALSTVEDAVIHRHDGRVSALSTFELTFTAAGRPFRLELEPDHDILPPGATESFLEPDGTISSPKVINRLDHKLYKGSAWAVSELGPDQWQSVGWAAITVLRDGLEPLFEGVFEVHGDFHEIQTSTNYAQTRLELDPEVPTSEEERMILWRHSDIIPNLAGSNKHDLRRAATARDPQAQSCQADRLLFNTQADHPVYLGMSKRPDGLFGSMDFSSLFAKRQIDSTTGGNSAGVNLASTIGQTAGCPSTRKVALVGVATDCGYTGNFNSSATARQNALTQMNKASRIWESAFNISLGVQNIIVSNANCPGSPAQATMWNQACSDSVNLQDRLNYFSAWRGTQSDSYSHWTLMSTCNTGSAVGLAWLGQACVQTAFTANSSNTGSGAASGAETVSGANVIVRTVGASEWQIIAHETGHTYGAVHDCYAGTCANANTVNAQQCCPLSSTTCDAGEQYIMNPSTVQGVTKFSACSIGNICSALGRNSVSSTCLVDNRQVTTVSEPVCGNGIVEQGEDCDCGGTEGCADDKCCDPTTCKFTAGSVCDDANEDCCRNCQLATNGTICRASTGMCDPAETCSGTSAICPADVTTPDGTGCGNGLQCASGQCTSRDQQCRTVMGSYTQGNDTYACDNSGCTISCASPQFGPGVCFSLQQNFLDGTVCGGGGKCSNGQCEGSTVGGEIKSWIESNKGIVIGIGSAVGFLLLLALLGCVRRCFRRRQLRKTMPVPPRMPPPTGRQTAGVYPPPPMQWRGDQAPYYPRPEEQGWSPYGPGPGGMAPVPPPAYPPRAASGRYA